MSITFVFRKSSRYSAALIACAAVFVAGCVGMEQKKEGESVDSSNNSASSISQGSALSEATAVKSTAQEIEMPSGKELVLEAQKILTQKGYNPGIADGILGQNTAKAVRKYQSDQRLAETGEIDKPTYLSLRNIENSDSLSKTKQHNGDKQSKESSSNAEPSFGEKLLKSIVQTYLPQKSGSQQRSMEGLEAVGPVNKPGCKGIEVVGYAEKQFRVYDSFYYMAVRNNNSVAKFVQVEYIGGRRSGGGDRLSGRTTLKIAAGDIHNWEIDYAASRPKHVEIIKCM